MVEKAAPEQFVIHRRIGATLYKVGIHFNEKETLDKKILRLLKNDLQTSSVNATMNLLQVDWLSERGSL